MDCILKQAEASEYDLAVKFMRITTAEVGPEE